MRFLCIGIALLMGCSGSSSPTTPDIPPQGTQILTLVSARNESLRIEGATVVVDGMTYHSKSDGTVQFPPTSAAIEISAPGYIAPRRVFVSGLYTERLIPDDDQLPFSWLRQVFYGEEGTDPLWRPDPGQFGIELSPELQSHAVFPHAIRQAIAVINAAQPNMRYFLVESGGRMHMKLDPDDPFFVENPGTWAYIWAEVSGNTIVKSTVTWKFLTRPDTNDHELLWHAAAHELGHNTGLWGHPPDGIMGAQWGIQDFNDREKQAMRFAFFRTPGTRAPDDSTQALVPASQRELKMSVQYMCALREP